MILIPLDRIQDSPFQTRQHYDQASIESLADSIERGGLDQVPKARIVSRLGSLIVGSVKAAQALYAGEPWRDGPPAGCLGHYDWSAQLAFGHRRLRAFRLIAERRGADQVSAATGLPGGIPYGFMPVELAPLTDEQMFAKAVGENAQRRDLSAVEEAEAMHVAVEKFGWTHEVVGERWGLSRSAVSNKIRLLKLPSSVRAHNLTGELSEAKCRALISAFDVADEHPDAAAEVEAFGVQSREKLAAAALRQESSSEVRKDVQLFVQSVEALAEKRERERKRREEPEMFEEREAIAPGDERYYEPKAAAESGISAEIERINAEHNAAILWIKDPSYVRAADDDVLEKTLAKLRPLVRQVESIIEDSEAEEIYEHGPTLDRIAGGIRYDVDRVSRELDRRKPADAELGDSFDDGGEHLNKISESQGLPPVSVEKEESVPARIRRERKERAAAMMERLTTLLHDHAGDFSSCEAADRVLAALAISHTTIPAVQRAAKALGVEAEKRLGFEENLAATAHLSVPEAVRLAVATLMFWEIDRAAEWQQETPIYDAMMTGVEVEIAAGRANDERLAELADVSADTIEAEAA